MKKKLITGILALSMCLPFASCDLFGGNNENLQGAADYVKGFYQDSADAATRADYNVMSSVEMDGVTYTITWSVDVTEGVEVVVANGKTTIDVSETLEADLAYVLTGTLTAPSGETKTVTFNRVVKAAPVMVSAPISAAPVEGTAYKLYVYQATKKVDCYFNGMVASTYYVGSVENYEESPDIFVEKVGDTNTFYYTFTNSEGQKQYLGVYESWNSKNNYWTFNPKISNEPVSAFEYSEEYGIMVSKVLARSEANHTNQDAVADTETLVYLGNYSTYTTFSATAVSEMNEDGNNVGTLVGLVDRSSVSAETKVIETMKELSVAPVYVGNYEVELAKQGTTYPDVTITWTAEGATVSGNKLTLAPTAATTVTLKATLKAGDVSEEVTLTTKSIPNETAAIIAAAKTLKDGESFANAVELEGVVSKIKTAYDSEYKNVTISMTVGTDTIDAYRLAGNGADVLAEGYTVKVKGILTVYKTTVQFGQGCEIVSYKEGEAPEEKPDESMVPGQGETLISKKMTELATDAWTDKGNVAASAVALDSVASFTIAGGSNSGKYYSSYGNVRIYSTDQPAGTLTITLAAGYELVSVKIETESDGTFAFLQIDGNDAEDLKNAIVTVSGSSVTFKTVRNGDNGKQVRVLGISVIYKAV